MATLTIDGVTFTPTGNPLVCTDCEWEGTPTGGRVFATARGGLFHSRTCDAYRAEHGFPERSRSQGSGATWEDVASLLAAPASAPVADAPAAETVVIDGKTYRAI